MAISNLINGLTSYQYHITTQVTTYITKPYTAFYFKLIIHGFIITHITQFVKVQRIIHSGVGTSGNA